LISFSFSYQNIPQSVTDAKVISKNLHVHNGL